VRRLGFDRIAALRFPSGCLGQAVSLRSAYKISGSTGFFWGGWGESIEGGRKIWGRKIGRRWGRGRWGEEELGVRGGLGRLLGRWS
jgi:hypothetical protein